jgi:glucokinase
MSAPLTIGIDLGGTNIKAGLVDEHQGLRSRREIPTEAERGCDHVIARLITLARELRQQLPASAESPAVGIGVPGPLDHARGIVHHAPNLPGWVNVPLRERLQRELGLPVCVENDANAAAFGEFVAGAGRDVRDMVMLTLGTGIGGGVVLDGKLWRGSFDNAGEIGHMIVEIGGRPCPCGQHGCLERYASATAIAQRYAEETAGRAGAAEAPAGPDAEEVLRRGESGDARAARIWDEACRYLAVACVNIQHLFNVQRIVLAGGLIQAGERLLDPLRRHFERLTWRIAPDHPQIALATLGNDAGLVGAAALARLTCHPSLHNRGDPP